MRHTTILFINFFCLAVFAQESKSIEPVDRVIQEELTDQLEALDKVENHIFTKFEAQGHKIVFYVNCRFTNLEVDLGRLDKCLFKNCHFTGRIKFSGGYHTHNTFLKCDFTKCDLQESTLGGIRFKNCNFNNTNLKGSKIFKAEFENNQWQGAQLQGVNLLRQKLSPER